MSKTQHIFNEFNSAEHDKMHVTFFDMYYALHICF